MELEGAGKRLQYGGVLRTRITLELLPLDLAPFLRILKLQHRIRSEAKPKVDVLTDDWCVVVCACER